MKFIHVISYMFATEFYTFLSWLVLSYPESKRILILNLSKNININIPIIISEV